MGQRIPISLLEVNTFGHAICALFIYLLWWEKPFEVDIPTTIESQPLLDLYALAWIRTRSASSKDLRPSPLVQSMTHDYLKLLEANRQYQESDGVSLLSCTSVIQAIRFEARHKMYCHIGADGNPSCVPAITSSWWKKVPGYFRLRVVTLIIM